MTTINTSNSTSGTTADYSRISGLASGIDTESMVKSMMTAERVPLDKLEQQKQILEWQQEDYRSLNTALCSFKDQAFKLKLQGTFNTKTAASANENVLGVTASGNVAEGSYAIKITQLAAGVSKGSTEDLNLEEKNSDGSQKTLRELFSLGAAASPITVNITGSKGTKDVEFNLDEDTIDTVAAKINEADLGIAASYDSSQNRFFLTTTTTGEDAKIIINSDSAHLLSNTSGQNDSLLKLNLTTGDTSNESNTGKNAIVDFGDAAGLQSATNTITVNGLTLNLKDTGTSTVTVSRDIDSVVSSIKNWVNSYNDTIGKFYSEIKENRNRDYSPLTDAQKEEMNEDEITKWEAKARSGLLKNDGLLNNLTSNLREAMSGIVAGVNGPTSLSQIGITTLSWNDNGKLYIDEDKLREALSTDPEGVKALFTTSSTDDKKKGIAVKLYDIVTAGITSLSDKAGSTSSLSVVDTSYIGKRLTEMDQEIEDWQDKLDDIQDRYYSKFTAMETALSQLNSQSSWLSQQFG